MLPSRRRVSAGSLKRKKRTADIRSRLFSIKVFMGSAHTPSRFSVTVSKRGTAVARNRVKRLVHEALSRSMHQCRAGVDILVTVRDVPQKTTLEEISRDIEDAFRSAGLIEPTMSRRMT